MMRAEYFNSAESDLSYLVTRIKIRGGFNILDLNLHAENFYLEFFNLLLSLQLKNINAIHHNAPGIDLIDEISQIIVQVSSTATKQKIESALSKDIKKYKGYKFLFIAIVEDASDLRTKKFANPCGLDFIPKDNIYDVKVILAIIQKESLDRQKIICNFLRGEIKRSVDPDRVETNLATIIKILSKEDWGMGSFEYEKIPFDVDRKILFNQLDATEILIEEHKIHYLRINKIYSDFDKSGVNKSLSILNGIRDEYISIDKNHTSDKIFLKIIDKVVLRIQNSLNYTPMAYEELQMCVQILVVDAFIRCKIFKNPVVKLNAST
jgi:transcriptional regulator NrdR family protein